MASKVIDQTQEISVWRQVRSTWERKGHVCGKLPGHRAGTPNAADKGGPLSEGEAGARCSRWGVPPVEKPDETAPVPKERSEHAVC